MDWDLQAKTAHVIDAVAQRILEASQPVYALLACDKNTKRCGSAHNTLLPALLVLAAVAQDQAEERVSAVLQLLWLAREADTAGADCLCKV